MMTKGSDPAAIGGVGRHVHEGADLARREDCATYDVCLIQRSLSGSRGVRDGSKAT